MIESRTSRTAMVGALFAAVFVAGIALGVISDRLVARRPVIKARFIGDMSGVLDQLRLTAQQRAQAESIITRRAPSSEALMIELADRLRAVSDSVDSELRAILTPGQRLRLDSLRTGGSTMMLKRKVVGPGGTSVDTVFPRARQ
ncbi:MAG: hypothetical protein WD825_07015 [Gemmatimonadaceae bacterium]